MEDSKTNAGQGLGIAGLVLGIVSLLIAFIPCIGLFALVPGIIAIAFSAIALNQAKRVNGARGLIIGALIISILGTTSQHSGFIYYILTYRTKMVEKTNRFRD